jgi:peptidylprolyl isomerase
MAYLVRVTDHVASPRRGSTSKRPQTGRPTKSKAEKRAEAKAAKARALAAKRRRKVLTIAGAVVVVIALVVGAVLYFGRSTHSTTPSGSASTAPSASASSSAAFPPLPAGADPALATKPVAKAGTGTVSKLAVTTLITGKGAAAKAGQTISVNYVGVTYADGKEFDSSWSRSQAFSFQLGAGNVIKGWDQGLVGVTVGSRVQLDIPSDLAYGDTSSNGSPTGALRFVVDVLSAA